MKQENTSKADAAALSAGILSVAALRALMAPYPNIEPVMLSTLATGLLFGPVAGFLMGAGSLLVSDFLMAPGPLTFPWLLMMPLVAAYTSLAYGFVGLFAGFLGGFRGLRGRLGFAALAAVMTLFYDFVTAVCFGLQFYGLSGVWAALVGQVPFTVLHLSNALFAFFLAPYVFKAVYGARALVLRGLYAVKTAFF